MPVRKFRSVEEMDEAAWRRPGDPALYRAIAAVWAMGHRSAAPRFPPGVYKRRSLDELNRATEAWQRENVERRTKDNRRRTNDHGSGAVRGD